MPAALEPPFGWIFYILQPLSDSEITNTAIDVFSALTDDSNLQFWRFEFVTLSSSSEASDCAEHFRSEKEHRVGAGGLALPDYSATRAYQYTNTVLIIRDVASWKPSGIDVFQFDINPNHRIAKKGKSPGENLYEGMNVRDEPVPFGGEAPDASDYTDKFGITVEQTMDLAWESQERLRELTEGFKKAAKGGKTRW